MNDVVLEVRVIPRAKRNAIGGERDGALVVRLAAPPVEGAANAALIEFLAATLDLPFAPVKVNLTALAWRTIRLRFRLGTDNNFSGDDFGPRGWWIDDVQITSTIAACTPTPTS